MKQIREGISKLISGLAMVLLMLACTGSGNNVNLKNVKLDAEKPSIDSARVLETLELYRAKRYEGIQDALSGGVDQAFKLVLYGRKLDRLSPEIGKLSYLQTLDVAQNELSELPDELSGLHYLQGFYANGNRLTAFPDQLLLLPILGSIDLSENQIVKIPAEIALMDQLTRLSMDDNMLTSIPVQLFELSNLTILELGGNGLTEIPAGIDSLKELKKLDLSNNQLRSVPKGLSNLSLNLKDLYLQGNQIPRDEIDNLIAALPSTKIRF